MNGDWAGRWAAIGGRAGPMIDERRPAERQLSDRISSSGRASEK